MSFDPSTPEPARVVSQAQFDEMLSVGPRLAEKGAAAMLARGVDPGIAAKHLRLAVEHAATTRANLLARQPAPAATNPTEQPAPPAATAPTAGQQPATAPPLAAPGSPLPHEIPTTRNPGEDLGAFFMRRAATANQARQAAGDGLLNMSLPMGLKAKR